MLRGDVCQTEKMCFSALEKLYWNVDNNQIRIMFNWGNSFFQWTIGERKSVCHICIQIVITTFKQTIPQGWRLIPSNRRCFSSIEQLELFDLHFIVVENIVM
jgi:hypothetical protein